MQGITIDEEAEAKISEAYARAAERASGMVPMSEDPKYQKHVKDTMPKMQKLD